MQSSHSLHPDIIPLDHLYFAFEDYLKGLDHTNKPKVHSSVHMLYQQLTKNLDHQQSLKMADLLNHLKPSNQPFVGMQELYASFEKVLTVLKNYKEHSIPFLQRVNKKDVPDYYDVIKNPMDLGTMSRKLKLHQYKTKKEFADDLYLIWSNCLQYNVHPPDNIYVRHANAMKKKTVELLKKVPDAAVRQEDLESDSDDEKSIEKSALSTDDPLKSFPVSLCSSTDDLTRLSFISRESSVQAEDDKVDTHDDWKDEEYFKWKDLTADYRKKWIMQKQMFSIDDFENNPAFILHPEDFRAYYDSLDEFSKRNLRRICCDYGSIHQDKLDEDVDSSLLLCECFLPEFMPVAIPCIPQPCYFFGSQQVQPKDFFRYHGLYSVFKSCLPSFSDYHSLSNESSLTCQVLKNVKELKKIKEIYAKILAKQMKLPENLLGIPPSIKPYQPRKTIKMMHQTILGEKQEEFPLPALSMTEPIAMAALRQVICLIVSHVGFDTCQQSALAIFMDIAKQYLLNLGRTIQLYNEYYKNKHVNKQFTSIILTHTLKENGVSHPSSLVLHVKNDIQRYGGKLWDLRRKLEYAYDNMCQEVDDIIINDEDIVMEDHNDQLVAGTLFEDVGIDLLGLNMVGIDSLSIPKELWNKKAEKPIKSKISRKIISESKESNESIPTRMIPPLPWKPIDPNAQIGLLQSFYQSKKEKDDMMEDDDKPRKSRTKQAGILKVALQGRKKFGIAIDSQIPERIVKKKKVDPSPGPKKRAEKAKKSFVEK